MSAVGQGDTPEEQNLCDLLRALEVGPWAAGLQPPWTAYGRAGSAARLPLR